MDLIVFGFNNWHEWAGNGFCTRSAITTLKLANSPEVERVLVVDAPSSIWVNALRSLPGSIAGARQPGTTLKPSVVNQVAGNVWVMDHSRLVPREGAFPYAYRVNALVHDGALRRRIRQAAAALGMRDIVAWVASPLMTKHFGTLGESLSVFDAIDDWSVHPQKTHMRGPILDGYATAKARADIVFTVSRDLADSLGDGRDDVHWIPNGVDVERFEGDLADPPELADLPRPLIGYVGMLQDRVDVEMIRAAAAQTPRGSVVLVGPVVTPAHFDAVRHMPNVHFLGSRSSGSVPAYISAFDVCLLPHVDDAFTRSMDPMKLYEYLAAGRPVVASGPVDDRVRELIYHASDSLSFARAVERAAAEDDPLLSARRREFARSRSWDGVVDTMMAIVRAKRAMTAKSAVA